MATADAQTFTDPVEAFPRDRPCSPSDGYRVIGRTKDALTTAKALKIAKEHHGGHVTTAVTDLLERKIVEVWAKIIDQPTSYMMSREEFCVLRYYSGRCNGNRIAQDAIARFRASFKAETFEDTSSNNRKQLGGSVQQLGFDTALVERRVLCFPLRSGEYLMVESPAETGSRKYQRHWPLRPSRMLETFVCYRCCEGYRSEMVRDRHLAHDKCKVRIFRGHIPGARQRAEPILPRAPYHSNADLLGPVYFRAICDYEANDTIGLSFLEGDIIRVTTKLASGWWAGEAHGTHGWFDCRYCEVIEEPHDTMAGATRRLVGSFSASSGPTMITHVDLAELLQSERPQKLLLLDVRSLPIYSKSRIRGAIKLGIPTTLPKGPTSDVRNSFDTFTREQDRKQFESIVVYDSESSKLKDAVSCIAILEKLMSASERRGSLILKGGFRIFSKAFPEHVNDRLIDVSRESHLEKSSACVRLKTPTTRLGIQKTAHALEISHGRGNRWDHCEDKDKISSLGVHYDDNVLTMASDNSEPSRHELGNGAKRLMWDGEARTITKRQRPNSKKSGTVVSQDIRNASDTAGVNLGETVQDQDVNATGDLMGPATVIIRDDVLNDCSVWDSTLETSSQSISSVPTVPTLMEHAPSECFQDIQICNGEEYTFVNSLKSYIEDLTAKPWNWWPLEPRYRPLKPGDVRVRWNCGSVHRHSSEVPRNKVASWQQNSPENPSNDNHSLSTEARLGPNPRTLADSNTGSSIISGERSDSDFSRNRSSSATSISDLSDPQDKEQDSNENGTPDEATRSPEKSVAIDIYKASTFKGFVLFGVVGSKRLRAPRLRLAQIDVKIFKDDDTFFDEIFIQYRKLRGYVRWIFSIWQFHTCKFVMFHKANPNEIMQGPEELPPITNKDYEFNSSRTPPILSTVFNAGFHGCNKACIRSQLDVLSLFHECRGRNHCGRYRVLDRLPKRCKKWKSDHDEEVEDAWGIDTVFGVSFFRVILYHLLILVGPLVSWGMWLKKWPTDWQNASVPFFAVMVLISLFWLPFAYGAREKEGKTKVD